MPELPEVETIARTLGPQVRNCLLEGAELLRPGSLHPLSLPLASLTGRCIVSVGRRGKLLLLHLAAPASAPENLPAAAQQGAPLPDVLAVHLRMTGRLTTQGPAARPGPHTRCLFDLRTPEGQSRRLFFDDARAFGLVLAATPEILHGWSFWRELGPEPLDLSERDFAALLCKRGGALKAVLLDQKVIAGIGNIYADESLFRAGLDPRRKAQSLDTGQSARLLAALKDVLRLSIAQCGSSIRDYRDANGDAGAFQNSFAVYGRAGAACIGCGRPLQKIRVAGRGTVFCQHCQS